MEQDILSLLGNEQQNIPQQEGMEQDKVDNDLLASMMTADGGDGNFQEKNKKEKKEEDEPTIKFKASEVKERLGKYSKDFMDNVMKNPTKFTVETSRGRMTIKDAIRKGWNPKTNDFDDVNSIEKSTERELSKLNDSDRDIAEKIMDPANAGIAAADAESLGLPPDSDMIAKAPDILTQQQQQHAAPQGQPQIDPAILQQMIGGKI